MVGDGYIRGHYFEYWIPLEFDVNGKQSVIAISLDDLDQIEGITSPNHVKLDVDGKELAKKYNIPIVHRLDGPVLNYRSDKISGLLDDLIVIFISIDGHLIILRILLDSYELIPIRANLNLGVMVANGISAAGSMFLAATIIMLPIAGLTLMINIAIGVVTRSAPTLNLFSFGFPITMIGAFVILYFSTNSLAFSFSDLINEAIETFQIYLEDVADG